MHREAGFLPIQSLDIEAESAITFDLYVNLPLNQKYLLYRRRGGVLASEQLDKFNLGNIKNFFVQKEDYPEFVRYVALRVMGMIGVENGSENQRKVMVSTAKAILSSTFGENNSAVTSALISNLNDIAGMIIESVLENSTGYNRKTFRRFAEIAKKGTDFQKHPLNVTSIAVLLTFGIGYNREELLSDVAMAGLLHDIGLSKLSPLIIAKAHEPMSLSPIERANLYRHPEYAVQILKEKNVILTPLLETLILQHHEEFNGSGYPMGLRGYNINELAQVLRVADDLDQIIATGYTTSINLRSQVIELLDRMYQQKIIEPNLCDRIRNVLF